MPNHLLPSRSLYTIFILTAVCLTLLQPAHASRPDIKWMAGGMTWNTLQRSSFSPDGQLFIEGDYPYLKIWRVSDGTYLRTVVTHTDHWVGPPSFNADNSKALVVGGAAYVVNLVDGSEVLKIRTPGAYVNQASFVPGSGNILTLDRLGGLRLIDGNDGSILQSTTSDANLSPSLKISRSGHRFVLIGSTPYGDVVRVYDVTSLSEIKSFSLDGRNIEFINISPLGNRLLVVDEDHRLVVLEIDSGAILHDVQTEYWQSADFMYDNQTVLTSTLGEIKAINIDDPSQVYEWETEELAGVVVSPSSNLFISWIDNSDIRMRVYQLGMPDYRPFAFANGQLTSTDYSPSGHLVAASDNLRTLMARNAETGQLERHINRYYFNTERIQFLDDDRIVTGSTNGLLLKWRVSQNVVEGSIDSPGPLISFALNRQRTQAGGWVSIDYTELLGIFDLVGSQPFTTVSIFIASIRHPPVFDLLFQKAYTFDGTLVELDRVSGKILRRFGDISDSAEEIALRHDDSLLATASSDGYVRIYRTSDGKCLHRLAGHLAPVRSVVFSPDGKYLVSSAYDDSFSWDETGNGSIIVWRVSDGAMLEFYDEECQPGVTDIAFAPNGSQLTWVRVDGVTVTAAFHPPANPLPNLSQIKQMPDQTPVVLNTCTGTYVGQGFMYVKSHDSHHGIRIIGNFDINQQWNLQYRALRVAGVLGTLPTGERYLHSARVELLNDGHIPIVTMANRAISVQAPPHLQRANPVGMDMTGVYGRTTGWVTAVAEDKSWITIWDGSRWKLPLVDADGNPGIRCYSNRAFTPYTVGEFVEVQGIITREESNGSIYPILHFDYSEQLAYKE